MQKKRMKLFPQHIPFQAGIGQQDINRVNEKDHAQGDCYDSRRTAISYHHSRFRLAA